MFLSCEGCPDFGCFSKITIFDVWDASEDAIHTWMLTHETVSFPRCSEQHEDQLMVPMGGGAVQVHNVRAEKLLKQGNNEGPGNLRK